jgi:hypothetical protein
MRSFSRTISNIKTIDDPIQQKWQHYIHAYHIIFLWNLISSGIIYVNEEEEQASQSSCKTFSVTNNDEPNNPSGIDGILPCESFQHTQSYDIADVSKRQNDRTESGHDRPLLYDLLVNK